MNPQNAVARPQRGFTIIEFMIALTLSLMVLSALTAVFVSNSRARTEIERANQQIENARYALELISDDLSLAGFMAEFNLRNSSRTALAALPDPCLTTLADLDASWHIHVQGYDNAETLSCIPDAEFQAGTDIVVIRRVATCVRGAANCNDIAGAPYFQASLCGAGAELGSDQEENYYRLDSDIGNLNRTRRDCDAANLANMRRFLTHIYYVAKEDKVGDGIPTLRRVELRNGVMTTVPMANGIQDLQFEYGLDTSGDGIPDVYNANPSTLGGCVGADCVQNWLDVMTVKVHLLARSSTTSPDFTDTKTYTLGLDSAGAAVTAGPFNDGFKRHAYQALVRLMNPAGRRP